MSDRLRYTGNDSRLFRLHSLSIILFEPEDLYFTATAFTLVNQILDLITNASNGVQFQGESELSSKQSDRCRKGLGGASPQHKKFFEK